MRSILVITALLMLVGCTEEQTFVANGKRCQVHGDSLIEGIVRADFLVGNRSDSAFMQAGRRLFPNTRNILFPNGGDKGMHFLYCPSCDSAWKAYRPSH